MSPQREEIQRRVDEARADFLGRRVREVWVEWATRQPNPKDSWLIGWDDLDDGQRVDRLIGLELAKLGRSEADNAITWFTTCFNCSTLMDSVYAETVRREQAEEALAKQRAALIDMLDLVGEIINLHWVPKEERAGRMPLADQHRKRAERARLVLGEAEG